MTRKRAAGLLGLAMAATVLTQASPAQAYSTVPYCQMALGAITPGGDHVLRTLAATTPPTAGASRWGAKDLLPDGQARLAGGLGLQSTPDLTGMNRRQYVVLGTEMYAVSYDVKGIDGDVVPGSVKQTKVGGGWGDFRYFENAKGAPVVKKVRTSTWQGFESMVISKCGSQGTLLLGVDHDTGAPYLYALGHANGTSTVIKSLGKVNRTWTESLIFHYFDDTDASAQPFGE